MPLLKSGNFTDQEAGQHNNLDELKTNQGKLGTVAHAYNPAYLEGP